MLFSALLSVGGVGRNQENLRMSSGRGAWEISKEEPHRCRRQSHLQVRRTETGGVSPTGERLLGSLSAMQTPDPPRPLHSANGLPLHHEKLCIQRQGKKWTCQGHYSQQGQLLLHLHSVRDCHNLSLSSYFVYLC